MPRTHAEINYAININQWKGLFLYVMVFPQLCQENYFCVNFGDNFVTTLKPIFTRRYDCCHEQLIN